MTEDEAVSAACATVGIEPPRARQYGRWLKANTLSGRNGKGDGRLIINDTHVTAWNWQTGQTETVSLRGVYTDEDRREFRDRMAARRRDDARRAAETAKKARALVEAARPSQHPYLVAKGFQHERALVLTAAEIARVGGEYLTPPAGGAKAIVVPARRGREITSVQLIWEDGTKKFLFGGEVGGASHRVSAGNDTWLCEGFATALSVRQAVKGFAHSASVLCCFSASNIAEVVKSVRGRCFIAADNDEPRAQFGGLGAGEYYAKQTGKPFAIPLALGDDFNDLHSKEGVFAVQRILSGRLKECAM